MTNEVELRSVALGRTIADAVVPTGEPLPARGVVESRLENILETLRQGDRRSAEDIRRFVRENDTWSFIEDDSRIVLDCYLTQEDGTIIYFCLGADKSASQKLTDEPTEDEKIAYVKEKAQVVSVWTYSVVALEALKFDAVPGFETIDLLRGTYERVETVELENGKNRGTLWAGRLRPSDRIQSLSWDESEIIGADVPLHSNKGLGTWAVSAAWLVDGGRMRGAEIMASLKTSGQEYYNLHDKLQNSSSLSSEERKVIYDRLMEIQAQNGFPEAELNWTTTIPDWLETEIELMHDETLWNEHVIEGIRQSLSEPTGFFLYEQELRARSVAALSIRRAQVTGQAPKKKLSK